ncbi:sensor histidine kinase [Mesonia mobilis]|uniref:sensor histidine kinase n=1 Tax=Mesonia mobilis TaxID=369791 RepID=UPI0026EDAA23|nr:ATP-binding protein [Mesonia mobilis]
MARWSFEQGFTEFIINQERERLNQLAVQLVDEYRANGNSWENVELDNASFFSGPPNRKFGPPRRMGPPPRSRSMAANNLDLGPPTALFDSEDNVVTGNVSRDSSAKQVTVDLISDRGRIGTLISYPPPTPNSEIAVEFAAQQNHAIIIIGLVSFALAIIIALGITPRILRPFESILAAVKALTARKYDTHLPNERADEFGELMSHINTLSTTLKNNENTKNQWLADISHELRTPLANLRGNLEVLIRKVRSPEEYELKINNALKEIDRLSKMVEQLLFLARFNHTSQELEHVDLIILLDESIQRNKETIKRKNLKVEFINEIEKGIEVPKYYTQIIIENLLSNAIKYSAEGEKIQILVGEENSKAFFQITNYGFKIDPEDQQKIFEPFYRSQQVKDHKINGTGLGLSIVRKAAETIHASVNLSTSNSKGTTFKITFKKSSSKF